MPIRVRLTFAFSFLGVVACSPTAPAEQAPLTVYLARYGGTYGFCERGDRCEYFFNPANCAELSLEISRETGSGCLVCGSGDNARKRCGDIGLECAFGRTDEGACLVCSYLNGTIVYNDCDGQDACALVACPPAPTCPAGTAAEADPGTCCGTLCVPQCDSVSCAPLDCESDTAPAYGEASCCGECLPLTCDMAVGCPGDARCVQMFSSDPTQNTGPHCVPKSAVCPIFDQPLDETCVGGEWTSSGVDSDQCPSAYVCLCPLYGVDPDNDCGNGFGSGQN